MVHKPLCHSRMLFKSHWSTRDLPSVWKWLWQLRQSRCPVSHGWVGSKAFLLLTRQPCLDAGRGELQIQGPGSCSVAVPCCKGVSLEVSPGPELFTLVGFATSLYAEGDVLLKAGHSYTLPFFFFYCFSLFHIENKSKTKVRTPTSLQSDELRRNLRGIHTLHGTNMYGERPNPRRFLCRSWQHPGQGDHVLCPTPTSCSLDCWHSPWLSCWGRARRAGFKRHGLCLHSRHRLYQRFSQILWDAMSFVIKRLEQAPGPGTHLCVTRRILSPNDRLFSKILLHRKAIHLVSSACLSIASTSEETLLITGEVMRSESAYLSPDASLKHYAQGTYVVFPFFACLSRTYTQSNYGTQGNSSKYI